ncbi:MAG: hypothetical protein MUF27_01870 [Acidobacteria bacterium]|nr:hypothetical protein [Acidobacteriota bacterium]
MRRGIVAALLAALAVAAAPGAEPPVPAAPGPAASATPAALDARLAEAAEAFNATDFERALEIARESASAAEIAMSAPGLDAATAAALRASLARAYDLGAQARLALGDRRGAGESVERLLRTRPGYRVDTAASGPAYAKLVEARRQSLVGFVVPECQPVACDRVLVDGQPAEFVPEQGFAVLAGQREVVLGRHNFRDAPAAPVKVPPGGRVALPATIEQTSRDLVITTIPPGVAVTLNGARVGVTASGPGGQPASLPLTLPSLAPDEYVLEFEAPCLRRVEQPVRLVLDAQDPAALVLDPVRLEPTRGTIDLRPPEGEGVLTLDGREVQPATVDACPGRHEVSWTSGGRRVFVQPIELAADETVVVRPVPRPTAAVVEGSEPLLPTGLGSTWNLVTIPAGPGAELAGRVASAIADPSAVPPLAPAARRLPAGELADLVRRAAPEADALILPLPGGDTARRLQRLAIVDPARRLLEWTAWPERDAAAAKRVADRLAGRDVALIVPLFGADLVRTRDGLVVAGVLPGGPAEAAGLVPGMRVLAIAGRVPGAAEGPLESLPGAVPGKPVPVKVRDGLGEKELRITPVPAIDAPLPAQRAQGLLLPDIARLDALRVAGREAERAAASVRAALLLAAAGADEAAAQALDRVTVDERLDPAGDAWGTVLFVQEAVARRLGRKDVAQAVHAQWAALREARLGGRLGPPLAAAVGAAD